MSTAIDYRQLIDTLKKDLAVKQDTLGKCIAQQEQLENEIGAIRGSIANFSRMLGMVFDEEEEMGLTDAIRQAFKSHVPNALIPTEIRDRLKATGYDITKHGNVLASIHSVVNRLSQRGEIVNAGQRTDGKVAYRWNRK